MSIALHRQIAQMMRRQAVVGPQLVFDAIVPDDTTYEMLGVKTGVGDLVEARASSIWLPDWENVYREFGDDEVGYSGGRVVRNIFRHSENLLDPVWQLQNSGTKISATVFEFGSQFNNITQRYSNQPAGRLYRLSFDLRVISGNTNLHFMTLNSAAGDNVSLNADNTLKRYSVLVPGPATTGSMWFGVQDRNASNWGQIELTRLQLEIIDGQSNQNPGDYVKTEATTVRTTYANENGNVEGVGRVVTEAVGAPLPEVPYATHAPQATNLLPYSSDYTQWVQSTPNAAVLNSAVGIDGITKNIEIEDNSNNPSTGLLHVSFNIPIANEVAVFSVVYFIKKKQSVTGYPAFRIGFRDTDVVVQDYSFDPTDGSYVALTPSPGFTSTASLVDEGDFWRLTLTAENTDGREYVYVLIFPAYSSTLGGSQSGSPMGTITVDHVQVVKASNDFAKTLAPIPTAGAEVTRLACDLAFDSANHDDTEGSYYLEVEY